MARLKTQRCWLCLCRTRKYRTYQLPMGGAVNVGWRTVHLCRKCDKLYDRVLRGEAAWQKLEAMAARANKFHNWKCPCLI